MIKRILCLLTALMLLLPAAATADDDAALNLQELRAWADSCKSRAMTATPLNDPTAAEALTDDGYMFVYDFATLYMAESVMSAQNALQAIVVYDFGEMAPRDTSVGMSWQEVAEAFYSVNPDLKGTDSAATLYALGMLPRGAYVGRAHRDGQRVQTIDYAVYEQFSSGAYSNAGLVYTMQDDHVVAIRAYGLNASCTQADVADALNSAMALAQETAYAQLPMSYTGTDLAPFQDDDLTFAGLYFPALTPEQAVSALGPALEDTWMEDGSSYLRTMLFGGCEIIFTYDGNKQNPVVDSLMITEDGLEGPRAIRVGDALHSVLNRFRHGEGEMSEDGLAETLYGAEGSASFGAARYGIDASAVLRYGATAKNGQPVLLYLTFDQLALSEILLYIND